MAQALYSFNVEKIDHSKTSLGSYEGKVLMIVNVASKCGLTPQYEGLEKIYEKYSAKGFEVLGFPANEFAGQEPGTNEEIAQFCTMNFGVKFPLFSKIVVKGPGQHPLYKFLTETIPAAKTKPDSGLKKKLEDKNLIPGRQPNDILWNFEKFLVNRKGEVIERFAPDIAPEDPMIIKAIESAL